MLNMLNAKFLLTLGLTTGLTLTSYLGYYIILYKAEVNYLRQHAKNLETELTQAKYNISLQNQKLAENAVAMSKFNVAKSSYNKIIENTYSNITTESKGCEDELDTIDRIFKLQGSYNR